MHEMTIERHLKISNNLNAGMFGAGAAGTARLMQQLQNAVNFTLERDRARTLLEFRAPPTQESLCHLPAALSGSLLCLQGPGGM